MSDQDSKPDYIVDPSGNVRDVRNARNSPPAASPAPSHSSYSPPVQPAPPRRPSSSAYFIPIPIGLIITVLILVLNRCSGGGTANVRLPNQSSSYSEHLLGDMFFDNGDYDKAITLYTVDINQNHLSG